MFFCTEAGAPLALSAELPLCDLEQVSIRSFLVKVSLAHLLNRIIVRRKQGDLQTGFKQFLLNGAIFTPPNLNVIFSN